MRAFKKTFPEDKKKQPTGDDVIIYTSDSKGNRAHPADVHSGWQSHVLTADLVKKNVLYILEIVG